MPMPIVAVPLFASVVSPSGLDYEFQTKIKETTEEMCMCNFEKQL